MRKRVERYDNVVHYNDYSQGGHFAIHERADEMAADLREFFHHFAWVSDSKENGGPSAVDMELAEMP